MAYSPGMKHATSVVAIAGLATLAFASSASATAHKVLPCHASVSAARPQQYTDVNVGVKTAAHAHVRTVAHYKSKDTTHTATANAHGRATISYYISGATTGYRVLVTVTVTKGGSSGHCSTAFTPR